MKDCIFCKIISGEIPGKRVYEDWTAFAGAKITLDEMHEKLKME